MDPERWKQVKQELDSKARLARVQQPEVDSKGSGARSSEEKNAEFLVNAIKRHKRGVAVALATLVVGLAATVYVVPLMRQRFQPSPPPLQRKLSRLTFFGYRPRWSPDGSKILFLTSLLQVFADVPKVYVVGLDGKPPRVLLPEFLTEFVGSPQVSWHPDGQRVSLWGTHRQLGASFWTVPVAGGTPIKSELTKQVEQQLKEVSATFSDFRWVPSGQALYLEGTAQGVRNLWRVEVDRQTLTWIGGPERLTIGPGLDTDLALSPDGKRLAFTTRTERTRIWSLAFNAVTGRTRGSGQPVTTAGVTTTGMDAWIPNLSRDGKKLVFRAQRGGLLKQEIREKTLEDGRETLLVVADNFGRYGPVWSRDGTRLAYRRYRSTNPERAQFGAASHSEASIVLLPAGGGEKQVLTSTTTLIDIASDWSASGERIIASSDRRTPGRLAICLFPISAAPQAETQMRVVTSHPEYSLYQGHFSPDERWINFNAIKAIDRVLAHRRSPRLTHHGGVGQHLDLGERGSLAGNLLHEATRNSDRSNTSRQETLNPERWRQIESIYHAVLEREPTAQGGSGGGVSKDSRSPRLRAALAVVSARASGRGACRSDHGRHGEESEGLG
ncbi:MAG: hypothetical protein L0312_32255 [Acidobacteria bacterium]|nr:hypothetical protein [Acidobacteriota bacterium]